MASLEQYGAIMLGVGVGLGCLLHSECDSDVPMDSYGSVREHYVLLPRTVDVPEGSLDTALIEGVWQDDVDGDGDFETVLQYDGVRYLGMVEDGRLVFREYKLVPDNPEED